MQTNMLLYKLQCLKIQLYSYILLTEANNLSLRTQAYKKKKNQFLSL